MPKQLTLRRLFCSSHIAAFAELLKPRLSAPERIVNTPSRLVSSAVVLMKNYRLQ